jgi:hypothetical protein
MKDKEAKSNARRDFFRKAGLGAGALGAAAVGLGSGKADAAAEGSADNRRKGYRETAHVKKYYELARF